MMDVAEQHGIHVEPHVLQAALGVPVVPHGGDEERRGARAGGRGRWSWRPLRRRSSPNRPTIRPEHGRCSRAVRGLIAGHMSRALPGGLGRAQAAGRGRRDHRADPGRAAAGRSGSSVHALLLAARGCLSGHRRRALRVDRAHGARRGHAAQGRRGHPHRAAGPGGHASDLGAGRCCWRCSAWSSGSPTRSRPRSPTGWRPRCWARSMRSPRPR